MTDGQPFRLKQKADINNMLIKFQLVQMPADAYYQLVTVRQDNAIHLNENNIFTAILNSPVAQEGNLEEWEVTLASFNTEL